jgi:hypothetical protein
MPDPDPPRPDDEQTRTFNRADLDALSALLREDARTYAAAHPPPKRSRARTQPPNIGTNLAVLLAVVIVALIVLAGLTVWLTV